MDPSLVPSFYLARFPQRKFCGLQEWCPKYHHAKEGRIEAQTDSYKHKFLTIREFGPRRIRAPRFFFAYLRYNLSMRFLIIGPGAVGCILGASLLKAVRM